MTVSNEDLLMEMHRVGALMRRTRFGAGSGGPHGHGHGPGGPHGHGPHGHGGQHADMPHHAFMVVPAPHGMPLPEGHPPVGHPPVGYPPMGGPCHHKGSGKHGQARILAALQLQDGMSQKDLAFLLGIRPQSLTVALEKLEAEGLIERKQDESDKRARRVYITDAGKQQAQTQAQERTSHADGVFAALTDEEKDQLSAILAKIAATLEKAQESETPDGAKDQA